jgi:SAM-dependent methyltransferase
MQTKKHYSPEYFSSIREQSRASAAVVAPLVVQQLQPRSVVDVGCGTGAWANAFKTAGVPDVLGIDGEYCQRASLEIAPDEFLATDLTRLVELPRRYDLAVCLEVAEHLEARLADQLVESLTRMAPIVLFSAAIPFQGGEHHVNEQWPSYWISLFNARGYDALDVLRQRLWSNRGVAWWYAQNMLLFVARNAPELAPQLITAFAPNTDSSPPSLVHPGCWFQLAWRNRVLEAAIQLMNATPTGAYILLVDNGELGELGDIRRGVEPFPEHDGLYYGPPADSQAAIDELERKLSAGATHIAIAWPAFWWLDHYAQLDHYLRDKLTAVATNESWVIFRRS